MQDEPYYRLVLLDNQHDRTAFYCGVNSLDNYIHRQAGQEGHRRVAVTYVLTQDTDPATICGYYTLSAYTLEVTELPETMIEDLPRYPLVGAMLLGRLAVDQRFRGRKLGRVLLIDALQRSLEQSTHVASVAVVVDALDESAKRFYEQHGFTPLSDQAHKLLIPMKAIQRLQAQDVPY